MNKYSRASASRRDFLKLSSVVGLGFLGLHHFVANPLLAQEAAAADQPFGYGPLVPDPQGVLELPRGFSYKIISRKGEKMNDGFLVPGKADAMATFAGPKGKIILVRNHEISPGDTGEGPFGKNNELLGNIKKKRLYDFGSGTKTGMGGTTTLVYNPETQTVEKQYLSLAGTARNCAGGLTPWNSWITCEETVERADGVLEKDHGYNFEVPVSHKIRLADPVPLKQMGRFNHEAVTVDPRTSIVYQTEDRSDGLIYRYLPNQPRKLAKGGKLQVLAIKGEESRDTRNWESLIGPKLEKRKLYEVEWLDIDDVESPEDDLRFRGVQQGAAVFARGEGMWFGNDEFYFACTNGGHHSLGQVFRYVPSLFEGTAREKEAPGRLELFVESDHSDLVKACDNLTISPWGDLVLCEDQPVPHLVGVTPQGQFYRLGKNVGFPSELAGAVFSPSGDTLFVNIQGPGLTLAITGPWKSKIVS
jgi:secreted PhoX family phosphatase